MEKGGTVVCIIPARGQSKRLKNKNIIDFLGEPLISHTILYAKRSNYIDEVFVTTDDDQIAEISKKYGAIVIKRPPELSNDYATTAAAVRHAVLSEFVQALDPVAVVTLQPTNPLRPKMLLDNAISSFIASVSSVDSLISVSLNKYKIGKINNDTFLPVTYSFGQRSQDMERYYYENGLIYITQTKLITDNEDLFGREIKTIIVDGPFGEVDIDVLEDLEWAEFIAKKYLNT